MNIRHTILFCIFMLFHLVDAYAQDVTFNYDNCGNRISRLIISRELNTINADTAFPEQDSLKLMTTLVNVIMFPNPTHDKAIVQCLDIDASTRIDISIYRQNGTLLDEKTENNSTFEINLESYVYGVYYIRLRMNNKVQYWKIIKQ